MLNSKLIESYGNISINNAIISQHTLYPYHFVNNGVQLNELGDKDLRVLIRHFVKNPGKLNVRQGGVSDELYLARIEVVLKEIEAGGVDSKKISISDGMPGGSGMPSKDVVLF